MFGTLNLYYVLCVAFKEESKRKLTFFKQRKPCKATCSNLAKVQGNDSCRKWMFSNSESSVVLCPGCRVCLLPRRSWGTSTQRAWTRPGSCCPWPSSGLTLSPVSPRGPSSTPRAKSHGLWFHWRETGKSKRLLPSHLFHEFGVWELRADRHSLCRAGAPGWDCRGCGRAAHALPVPTKAAAPALWFLAQLGFLWAGLSVPRNAGLVKQHL